MRGSNYDRSGFRSNILKPLSKIKIRSYDFVGFDVETSGVNNDFYMGGLFYYDKNGEEIYKSYYNKKEMIQELLYNSFYKGKYIIATNLSFDLSVLLFGCDEWNNLKIINRAGDIIYAEKSFPDSNKKGKIKFLDTMNFIKLSVQKLGGILKIPKMESPGFIGNIPVNQEEEDYLREYNKRDCEISCKFMYFFTAEIQ